MCIRDSLSTVRTKNYEEALELVKTNQYGNGTAIFTRDGDTARDFANKVNVGMVGVNVPIPVPLAYHTFGGWKKSSFGDLNQHGPDEHGLKSFLREGLGATAGIFWDLGEDSTPPINV